MDQYMKEVKRFPILSRDEEKEAAIAYSNGDLLARQKLINANLRFVMQKAHSHKGYINDRGTTLADLVQHGNIGLIRGVDKFDHTKGYRLITYAVWWILAEMRGYIITNLNVVRYGTTTAERTLFFKYGEIMDKLWLAKKSEERYEDTRKRLAATYCVSVEAFVSFERRMLEFESSMDAPLHNRSHGENGNAREQTLHDSVGKEANQHKFVEKSQLKEVVKNMLDGDLLSERELYMLNNRYLVNDTQTLKRVAEHYGLSRERARQICNKALAKLRVHFVEQGYNFQSLAA